MSTIREKVDYVLIHADIEGLIEAGAPQDEYSDEAAQLAAVIEAMPSHEQTPDAVLSALSIIWMNSFNLSSEDMVLRIDALRRVSEQLAS